MFDAVLKELRVSREVLNTASASIKKLAQEKSQLQKARESLKEKKYKDPKNNKDISFSTAYNRKVPQAQEDLQKALSNVKEEEKGSKKEEGSLDVGELNEEQVDLLERISKGKKTSDMSLVEQRTLRESLSLLLEAQEGIKEKEGIEEPIKDAEKSKKKQYAKKVKKEIIEISPKVVKKRIKKENLPKDTTIEDLVDVETLSETFSDDAKSIKGVIEKQELSRAEKVKKKLKQKKEVSKSDKSKILKSLQDSVDRFSETALTDINDSIQQLEEKLKDSSVSESRKKDLKEEIEDLNYKKDIRETTIKSTQKKYKDSLSDAMEEIPDFTSEQTQKLSESYARMGGDLISKIEDTANLKNYVDEQMSSLENLDTDSEDYPENVGKLMALKTMKEEVIEDPTFGWSSPSLDSSPEFLQEYKEMLGEEQRKKFNSYTEEERGAATKKLAYEKEDLLDKIEDPNATLAEKKEAQRRLIVVQESESALNTSRLINGEDPIDGYYFVDKGLLELAKTNNGDEGSSPYREDLLKAISVISRTDFSNEEMRTVVKTSLENMKREDLASIMEENASYQEMKDVLEPNYCPVHPKNEIKGVSGQTLNDMSQCPVPVTDEMKSLIKDTAISSFLDIQTSFKAQKQKMSLSPRKNKNLSSFLKDHKEDFMSILISGSKKDGTKITEEEKEDFMNFFFLKIRGLNVLNLEIQGVKIKGVRDIMKQLNKVRRLEGEKKIKATKELNDVFLDLMERDPVQKQSSFNNLFINPANTYGGVSMHKRSTTDYQKRSKDFKVGMKVYFTWAANDSQPGVVAAVYPSIGMVDVEYPNGSQRIPVEELYIDQSGDVAGAVESTVPGGVGVVPISTRVANRYLKKAIYWRSLNRKYRLCKGENPNKPTCPKCKSPMGKTVYKRRDSVSEKLFACPSCLFIIKSSDVEGAN